jgi:hypothetical protein
MMSLNTNTGIGASQCPARATIDPQEGCSNIEEIGKWRKVAISLRDHAGSWWTWALEHAR